MFGKSLHVDIYGVSPSDCDNMEMCYRFLEALVEYIEMTPTAPPFVIHGPRKGGIELYPDKEGLTAFIPLIESGITFHSVKNGFIALDIFTCGKLEEEKVVEFIREWYRPTKCASMVLERGLTYNKSWLNPPIE